MTAPRLVPGEVLAAVSVPLEPQRWSTFLGSAQRLSWWRERPPSDVVIVLPRPRWEGPGARTATDTCDSVWVLWREGFQGRQPRLHWLDVREETR